MNRNRILYSIGTILIICLGLFSRSSYLPDGFLKTYAGDTLYAVMVYLLLASVFIHKKNYSLCMMTCIICYVIECSQLLDFAWLEYARQTPLRFLLGQGFVWSDLLCYTIGACIGVILDVFLCTYKRKKAY